MLALRGMENFLEHAGNFCQVKTDGTTTYERTKGHMDGIVIFDIINSENMILHFSCFIYTICPICNRIFIESVTSCPSAGCLVGWSAGLL